MKKVFFKAVADGIVAGFMYVAAFLFELLPIENRFSYLPFLICIVCALLSGAVYLLLLRGEENNKRMLILSAVSLIMFLITVFLSLIIHNSVPLLDNIFHISPQEYNNADGLMILFISCEFLLLSFVLRGLVFLGCFIKNKYNNKLNSKHKKQEEPQKTEDKNQA